ncbi:WYL domain-containing protein [Streptomyces sp. NPDC058001]|uniref:helix-turn-helix transcriptional regulator n=1 Tax=Streptomyces sp. NPDC058001 TaxID=3346300 RepID=UPI0036EC2908
MRADRLVATLLFLQTRGRVTAAQVATELGVAERTARRDLEALASAGVPVYSQPGRGGGWSLVGGARTDLTGLTATEIRALFLVAGPSAVTPELRTALRKLVRALPAPLRPDAEAASRAGVTDGTDWSRTEVTASEPHLDALRRAVLDGTVVRLGYAGPGRPTGERTVHPLGLASKAGVEYLVAGTERGTRTFRLSRVTSVEPTGEPVVRPDGFDLATEWRTLAGRMEDRMRAATVRARAEPGAGPLLDRMFGARLRVTGRDPDGWLAIHLDGPSPEILASQLAGLGTRIEILTPPETRTHLARLGTELTGLYGGDTPVSAGAGSPGSTDVGSPGSADAGSPGSADTGSPGSADAGSSGPADAEPPHSADAGTPGPPHAGKPDSADAGSSGPAGAEPPHPADARLPGSADAKKPDSADAGAPDSPDAGTPPTGTPAPPHHTQQPRQAP